MLYEKLLDKYFSKHSLDHSYKQNKNVKNKKYLNDALLTSIAGISAAMKNTG